MTGDCHVQFSESARVRFLRATQLFPLVFVGSVSIADPQSTPGSRRRLRYQLHHKPLCWKSSLPQRCRSRSIELWTS
jgi:hypothetical protein